MAGFASPFLVLALALAAVSAMPLEHPDQPEITVVIDDRRSSTTDAPAVVATTPRLLRNDTEDAVNLIPDADELGEAVDKAAEREDAPVTAPQQEKVAAEDKAEVAVEAAPTERAPRPDDDPVTAAPAESVTAQAADKVQGVSTAAPATLDVDETTAPQAGEEVAATTVPPVEEIPETTYPQREEEVPATTAPPVEEEVSVTTAVPLVEEVPVTTTAPQVEEEAPVTTVAQAEDGPVTTVSPPVEDEVSATTAPRAQEDISATTGNEASDVSATTVNEAADVSATTGNEAADVSATTAVPAEDVPVTTAAQAEENVVVTTVPPADENVPVTSTPAEEQAVPETSSPQAEEPQTSSPSEDAAAVVEADGVTTVAPVQEDVVEGRSDADEGVAEVDKQPSTAETTELPPQVTSADLDAMTNVVVDTVASTAQPEVSDAVDAVAVTVVVENTDAMVTEAATTEEPVPDRGASEGRGHAFDDVLVPSQEPAAQLLSSSEAPLAVTEVPSPASEEPQAPSEVVANKLPEAIPAAEQRPEDAPSASTVQSTAETSSDTADQASSPSAVPAAEAGAEAEGTKPIGAPAPQQAETAAPLDSTASTTTSRTTEAARSVTRGGAARPINEATEEASPRPGDVEAEARAVMAKPTPASAGRSLVAGDGVVGSPVAGPDCPKDVMEADARFVVILVLLAALSVLGVSVIVLVMKFRVKPAARRSMSMSMCWCLRWGRARRATITPPFNHHQRHHTEAQGERGTKANSVKGTEDYNLASDEDCRRGEQVDGGEVQAPQQQQQQQDMPTWTFYEKGIGMPARAPAAAGPQSPAAPDHNHEDEVVSSKM